MHNWPKETELADLNSMCHFANYLREFIPGFIDMVEPLKPYRKNGAKWEDYLLDKKAQQAPAKLRIQLKRIRLWLIQTTRRLVIISKRVDLSNSTSMPVTMDMRQCCANALRCTALPGPLRS